MPAKGGTGRVVFDDDAWADDMARTSADGRRIGEETRHSYEHNGCPLQALIACQEDAPDGTSLRGCVKVYLPPPAGKFGIVFAVRRQQGRLVLVCVAFGTRHQPAGAHAPTVYQTAHGRLA